MKALEIALLSALLYAMQSFVIAKKLSNFSPMVTLTFPFLITFGAGAVVVYFFRDNLGINMVMPVKYEWLWVLLCGALLFFGELLYFYAFNQGGSLFMITMSLTAIPVLSSILNAMAGGEIPSTKKFLGWVLAVVAVFLVGGK